MSTRTRDEDYVIDMVVEVDVRGVELDRLARRLAVPGVEILTTTGDGLLWLTAVVGAETELAAVQALQSSILEQIAVGCGSAVATVLASAQLGDLYACLDPCPHDEALCRMDLVDLVAGTLWQGPTLADPRLASMGRLASTA